MGPFNCEKFCHCAIHCVLILLSINITYLYLIYFRAHFSNVSNSLSLTVYFWVKKLSNLPENLTLSTIHHHLIFISQTVSWSQWWRNWIMHTENWWISKCSGNRITTSARHPISTDLPSHPEILHPWPGQGGVISKPSRWINIWQNDQKLVEIPIGSWLQVKLWYIIIIKSGGCVSCGLIRKFNLRTRLG